ncbi:MAG: bifunctional folylpolyglutamate synthase/dihydrofolate synthase, partial [Clostridiales bacterium]|nr:bifunctional folylpolyglutamate synthase/dihydrofolate synthase [Clostridiales bacterium]
PRSLPAEALAEEIRRLTGLPARSCDSVELGVETALERCRPDTGVCALGSLYFSGAIRQAATARF